MKIDILATHGSPLEVTLKSVYGEDGRMGVGGAELALLTMCEEWAKVGHDVTLYNNPSTIAQIPFKQKHLNEFMRKEPRDVLIAFRAPTQRIEHAEGMKVWWTTDQETIEDYVSFSNLVHKIVCISPYHQKYFETRYGITDTVSIDLPVRIEDYKEELPKISNRCIFTSVPDRGLSILTDCWDEISAIVKDASLVITSDYRLWGAPYAMNETYRARFLRKEGVKFLGAIKRRDLVREQLQAEVLAYPCNYEELFCYAVAEACVAGVMPITSDIGALSTTSFGGIITGDFNSNEWKKKFIKTVIEYLTNPDKSSINKRIREQAIARFSPEVILKQWDTKVFV